MNWTPQAEKLLLDVPDFVSEKLRKKIEREARRCNLNRIDTNFVKKQSRPHAHKTAPPEVTDTPLSKAFSRKYAIHAGMMGGQTLEGEPVEWLQRELQHNAPATPAMAYLHVPFCTNRCLFCGFYKESSVLSVMNDYASALIEDITLSGRLLKESGAELQAIYFGGGTPTDLSAADLTRLLSTVRNELPLSSDCELTIEGRLFGFDDDKLKATLDGGANRFSFGVQAFSTEIRRRVGRRLAREELIERLNRIVQLGSPYQAAVVIDLIYGLPGQSTQAWLADIDCAIEETDIHGLDLYQINMIPGTPLDHIKDKLPPMADLQQQSSLFAAGRRTMYKAGFERLSIAHWGRSPLERNRYNSWNKRGANCMPLGCGAGGRWGSTRLFQDSDLTSYMTTIKSGKKPLVSAMANPSHAAVAALSVGQLEQQRLDLNLLQEKAGRPLKDQLRPMVEHWQNAGLLYFDPRNDRAILSEAGEFWVVNLQQLLDSRLKEILCAPSDR